MGTAEGAEKGRTEGSAFQDLFEKQSKRNGLLAIRNHYTAKYQYSGTISVVKSELDYKLINQKGSVGYFDCKSFQQDHFTYSMIDEKQIERACLYNEWNVRSGFVVWLREINRVVFYSGHIIKGRGPGNRFESHDGLHLGKFESFDLRLLLR